MSRKRRDQKKAALERLGELECLEGLRQLVRDENAVDEIRKWFGALPASTVFAMDSATWEMRGEMPEAKKGEKFFFGKYSLEMVALFMAGLMRCSKNRCEHDRLGQMFVFLSARLVSCKQCLPRFASILEDHDKAVRNGTDPHRTECDLCLKTGVPIFQQFTSAFNGIMFHGDACEDCYTLLKDGQQS